MSDLGDFRVGFLAVIVAVACALAGPSVALAGTTPAVDGEWASNVTEHDATLNAEINPNEAPTLYFFEIDTIRSDNFTHAFCPFGPCTGAEVGPPLPPGLIEPPLGEIPPLTGDQDASVDMASIGATLEPGTTYHFRVLAHVALGAGDYAESETAAGPEKSFTTLSPVASPGSAAMTEETYLTPYVEIRANDISVSGPWVKVTYGCTLPEGQICKGNTALHSVPHVRRAGVPSRSFPLSQGRQLRMLGGEVRSVALRLTRPAFTDLQKGEGCEARLSFLPYPPLPDGYASRIVHLTPDFRQADRPVDFDGTSADGHRPEQAAVGNSVE